MFSIQEDKNDDCSLNMLIGILGLQHLSFKFYITHVCIYHSIQSKVQASQGINNTSDHLGEVKILAIKLL